ncbi:zinc ribbon domain-containing protein [Streptomyces sp. NPDC001635]
MDPLSLVACPRWRDPLRDGVPQGRALVRVLPRGRPRRHARAACHAGYGRVSESNRESQAVFRCKNPGCGHTAHADVNAAVNIKHAAGHAVSACGDLGASRSTKQEPVSRATGRTPKAARSAAQGIPAP